MDSGTIVNILALAVGFAAQLAVSAFVYGQLTERVKAMTERLNDMVSKFDMMHGVHTQLIELQAMHNALHDRVERLEEKA